MHRELASPTSEATLVDLAVLAPCLSTFIGMCCSMVMFRKGRTSSPPMGELLSPTIRGSYHTVWFIMTVVWQRAVNTGKWQSERPPRRKGTWSPGDLRCSPYPTTLGLCMAIPAEGLLALSFLQAVPPGLTSGSSGTPLGSGEHPTASHL